MQTKAAVFHSDKIAGAGPHELTGSRWSSTHIKTRCASSFTKNTSEEKWRRETALLLCWRRRFSPEKTHDL